MKDFEKIKSQMEVLEKIKDGDFFHEALCKNASVKELDFGNVTKMMSYLNDFSEDVSNKIRNIYKGDTTVIWTPSSRTTDSYGSRARSWIKILGDDVGIVRLQAYRDSNGSNNYNSIDLMFHPYAMEQENVDCVVDILNSSLFEVLYSNGSNGFKDKFSELREHDKENVINHIYSLKTRNTKMDEWLSETHPETVKRVLMGGVGDSIEDKKEV